MATLTDIQDAVDQATLYHGELVDELRADLIEGCDCDCGSKLNCLQASIYALQYDIDTDTNTDRTTRVYNVLQGLISGFSGAFNPDPDVVINGYTIVLSAGTILQTAVVFPYIDDVTPVDSYTFGELVGKEVLTVYRGTGVVLRATSGSPSNEYAKFDSLTGKITVSYDFSDGESLWVEYKTT